MKRKFEKRTRLTIYLDEPTKAKLEDRAGRESLSSFVSGLIDNYFEEYPGLSEAEMARLPKFKASDTVNLVRPVRFTPRDVIVTVGPTLKATRAQYEKATSDIEIKVPPEYEGKGKPRYSVDEGKTWHDAGALMPSTPDISGQPECEHGATFPNCKKWGCKFYEIPNGRR